MNTIVWKSYSIESQSFSYLMVVHVTFDDNSFRLCSEKFWPIYYTVIV